MKYEVLNEEVQKTYYYAKKILDSQGFNKQLGTYLALGRRNQPEEWKGLWLGYILKPISILLIIAGIILIITRHILLGIGLIVVSILIAIYFGGKIKKYLMNSPVIETASQKIGSHRLMKIVAEEMTRDSSIEEIAEMLKKEILKVAYQN